MVLRIACRHRSTGSRALLPSQCTASRTYATVVPAAPIAQIHNPVHAVQRYPSTQPPSYRPAELRKTQIHRQYTSILRSTPLMLVLQHNNLKASEWAGIRRELALALRKAAPKPADGAAAPLQDPSESVRIQIIKTGIFAAALRVTEFFRPRNAQGAVHASEQEDEALTHALSEAAYQATKPSKKALKKRGLKGRAAKHIKKRTPLHRLLKGPIALVTFPEVAPQHLKTALSIIAPTPGSQSAFPAPKRRDAPGYYEPAVQAGLQKLLLLGARVEGRVVDQEGVRHVGGLPTLEGLRGQLVNLLASVGMGITGTLESAGRSLWFNLEARRLDMEEQSKPKEGEAEAKPESTA